MSSQLAVWHKLDVMDRQQLDRAFQRYEPTHIIHLAARADTDSDSVQDYEINVLGTRAVLEAAADAAVERVVHTSTQYVYRLGAHPRSDLDFAPFTAYGTSKVESERICRQADSVPWVIARPTNIWGPWHPRYPHEFWRVLAKGLYLHPRDGSVLRAYGYVENTADQLLGLASADADDVVGQVFYIGDPPIDLAEWVDAFSMELRGKPARRVPTAWLRGMAACGDMLSKVGVRAPLTRSRLRNMVEPHVAPVDKTIATLGPPRITMPEGVRRTVAWLRTQSLGAG